MKAGWRLVPLGEVCTLQRGFDLPAAQRIPGRFPLVTSSGPTDTHQEAKVKGPGVVTGRSGSIGNVYFVEQDFWPLNTALYVKDFHENDPKFVWYLLQFFDLSRFSSGTGVPTLNRNDVHGEAVSVPVSIAEQKRIVAVLDEAFEGLSRARANAEANLADARELFESYLAREFSDPPPDWRRATLGSLCRQMTVGHVGPMADRYSANGVPFLRSQNIRPFRVDLTDVKYIGPEFMSELKKSELRPGDVAIVRTGYPGTCAVIPEELELANCADLVIARPGPDLDPHFMALLLNSKYGKEHVAEVSVGAAQKHFNVGAAKAAAFPIPPIAVQRELVEMAAQVREHGQWIEEATLEKERLIDSLRQALLQKAFSGELT